MSLRLKEYCAGPLQNNAIVIYEDTSKECIIFDPSFGVESVYDFIQTEQLRVIEILFTHGHFDHFAGLAFLLSKISPCPLVGLHSADLVLWRDGGGSRQFRISIQTPGDPDFLLEHAQKISLGKSEIEVRHTPGHSPGSVIFYIPDLKTAVVGDLIFHNSIGRTDLDGGSFKALKQSVQTQVFTLPEDTVLVPGHGPETTVAYEMNHNPFVGINANLDIED